MPGHDYLMFICIEISSNIVSVGNIRGFLNACDNCISADFTVLDFQCLLACNPLKNSSGKCKPVFYSFKPSDLLTTYR